VEEKLSGRSKQVEARTGLNIPAIEEEKTLQMTKAA